MRRVVVALIAVVFPACLVGASASPNAAKVRITYVTPTVSPGGTLTIKASGPVDARCTATLSLGVRSVAELASHKLASGHTSWTYQLPGTAKLGNYRASVSCSKAGRDSAAFKVGAPPIAPAQISVVRSGFSTQPLGGQTFLYCGVQLQNTSTSDARNVAVTVTFADTQGRSVATDEVDLTVIPAGETFYASCIKLTSVTLSVASVQVVVKVGKSAARGAKLPVVSELKLTPDEFGGTQTLTGNLTNPYTKPMPEDAVIYAVYYDASGNIVGGGQTNAGASVQAGAIVGFSFPYIAGNIANVQVSVDPCGLDSVLGTCLGSRGRRNSCLFERA